jgi:NADPH:quinone reductase-like Zn-dependent oxidoreductase
MGNHAWSSMRRVLRPGGTYVAAGGPDWRWIACLPSAIRLRLYALFTSQKPVGFTARRTQADLQQLRELMATGKLKPVIDGRHGFAEVAEAIRYVEQGHARGNIAIELVRAG